jgi:hypothetical protein
VWGEDIGDRMAVEEEDVIENRHRFVCCSPRLKDVLCKGWESARCTSLEEGRHGSLHIFRLLLEEGRIVNDERNKTGFDYHQSNNRIG